jgi:hypothetical protein
MEKFNLQKCNGKRQSPFESLSMEDEGLLSRAGGGKIACSHYLLLSYPKQK